MLMGISNSAPAQALVLDWAKVIASAGLNEGESSGKAVAVDAQGNVYITGALFGTQHFGNITLRATAPAPAFGMDIFIAKLDSTGQVLWAVQGGGPSSDYSTGIALDAQGNVYITGGYLGATATYGGITLQSTGFSSMFIAKLAPDGRWLWAVGSPDGDTIENSVIAVRADGTVYVTGDFGNYLGNTLTLGPFTLTSRGDGDVFVAQRSSAGVWRWAVRAGGTADEQARSLALDTAGNAYLTGRFASINATFGSTSLPYTAPLQGTSPDVFVAKIDAAGAWQWAAAAGGNGIDIGLSIAVDKRQRVYLTGTFQNQANFGNTQLTSLGESDAFTACLSQAGGWQWAVAAGGIGGDGGAAIVADEAGYAYVGGSFGYGIIRGTTAQFGTTTLQSRGTSDAFVTRIDSIGQYHGAVAGGGTTEDGCLGIFAKGKSIYTTGYFSTENFSPGIAQFGAFTLMGNPTTFARMTAGWVARMPNPGYRNGFPPDGGTVDNWDAQANLPNIITPNGDGRNDTFAPRNLPNGSWQLTIYTRWGTRLYENANYQSGWGPEAIDGVYYYLLRHTETGRKYKGWLEVVR